MGILDCLFGNNNEDEEEDNGPEFVKKYAGVKSEYCIGEPVEVALKDFGIVKGKVIKINPNKMLYDDGGCPYGYTNYLIEFKVKGRKLQKEVPHSLKTFTCVWIRSLL